LPRDSRPQRLYGCEACHVARGCIRFAGLWREAI
jgi:hypothetical protein